MQTRFGGVLALGVFSMLAIAACGAMRKQMNKGDWTFNAARVPVAGEACVNQCYGQFERCSATVEATGGETGAQQACTSSVYDCYLGCPDASENVAAGKDDPDSIEEQACNEGITGLHYCVSIGPNGVPRFTDPDRGALLAAKRAELEQRRANRQSGVGELKVGDVVRAEWSKDGQYYDAHVIGVTATEIKVKFDADGIVEQRPRDKVRRR